jgi:iron complex transport system substrate-binding protein
MKGLVSLVLSLLCVFAPLAGQGAAVVDALGNPVALDGPALKVLCSGSGALRLLTYLGAQDRIVAVEDIEKRVQAVDPRPYFLANPGFRDLPLFGEFRGKARPELILGLPELPQVIFKTYPEAGTNAAALQEATTVPVIPLQYGDLLGGRDDFYRSLKAMGAVTGREERAGEVIAFFEKAIADLGSRTEGLAERDRPSCFVGGVAYRGAHGLASTELAYPPFVFTAARAVTEAEAPSERSAHSEISREKLLAWDPEYLFIDLATLNAGERAGALYELKVTPLWKDLRAVREGRVYGILPYNWYAQNYGSVLANAYFVGKILYPDRFADVDPAAKADEIYRFLVGKALFAQIDASFDGMAFRRLDLK